MANDTRATRRSLLQGAGALALGAVASNAMAAGYPDRPIRIIAPFTAGGPSDITARLMAVELANALGQSLIVENRPGAGSNLGTVAVARSAPDGYTLLITSSAFVVNPSLYRQVPYDPFRDFAPVVELDTSPNVFIASNASGIRSIKDMMAHAKRNPNELSYAHAGLGTTPQLAGELLKIIEGVNITAVPYQGGGPAVQAVLAGTVPLGCASLPGAHPHIKSGAIRALAVTSPQRWFDLPDVPTMLELGYADFIVDTFHCMLAPAGTPTEIVDLLANTSINRLKDPVVHDKLRSLGFETIANGPEGLRRRIEADVLRYRNIIAKAGIERV